MTRHEVLFVDDDMQFFSACRLALGKQHTFILAASPNEALDMLSVQAPFVVVVDPFLPGLDGTAFLFRAREIAPETLYVALARPVGVEKIFDLANRTRVFALLGKPCPVEALEAVLNEASELIRGPQAERQLLNATLRGAIKMLTDLMSVSCPEAFRRATRVRRLALDIARYIAVRNTWQLEAAAMLSQLGQVALPRRPHSPKRPVSMGQQDNSSHTAQLLKIVHDLLANIPQLSEVARIVLYQEKSFDGSGPPKEALRGEEIPLTSRILKIALDFDTLAQTLPGEADPAFSSDRIVELLQQRKEWYDPRLLEALDSMINLPEGYECQHVDASRLMPGMLLDETLRGSRKEAIFNKGTELNKATIQSIRAYARQHGYVQPIRVLVPPEDALLMAKLIGS